MMTVAEFKKLTNNEMFEVEYIRDYNGSGKAGVTVTSLVEGYEGNYIFLPEGHYWTSELAGSIELATQVTTPLAVESGQFEFEDVGRYFGNVVRGIRGTAPADFDPIDLPASPEYPSGYDENGNAYVEMGNGLRWATENVGAESFAASGEFFAWGETVTKESFTWDTYFDTQDGGASFLKYARNKLTVLAPEDDAASVKMGGTWRIPTIAEWNSFLNEENATCTETNNYENSGVGGYIVTSKVEGYVGNSIFFPAPGYMIGDELNGAGSTAAYWASDLSTTNDQTAFSKVLSFPSSNYQRPRNAGYSVRGVMPVPSDDASGRR